MENNNETNVNMNANNFNNREEAVTVKDWLITMLVMMVPFVNVVMMFVWAFTDGTNKSKSNFFKASLIMMVISIVLSIVFSGILVAMLIPVLEGMNF